MSTRTLAPAAADRGAMRGRTLRNLLIAILLPLALAAAYFAGHAGAETRTADIPAMIVNEDQMVDQTNVDGTVTPVVAGRLVVSRLTDPTQPTGFDWTLASREQAEQALEDGTASVVVIIPSDFSASVVSFGGGDPRRAHVELKTDQSHEWLAPFAGRILADSMVAQFGTQLTEQIVGGIVDGMDETGAALAQAADGARKLQDGASQLADGGTQLALGANQLGDGATQLADGQRQLADGADQAAAGATQYVDGVQQYVNGASALASGAHSYAAGVQQYVDGVGQYTSGVDQYASGVNQLVGPIAQIGDQYGPQLQQLPQLDVTGAQVDQAITGAGNAYEQAKSQANASIGDPNGTMAAFCATLPADQQAQCLAAIPQAGQVDWSQADAAMSQLEANRTGIVSAIDGMGGMGGLAGQLGQLVSGAQQLRDAGAQVTSGSAQLRTGGQDLADGGDQYAAGVDQFAAGGAPLVQGGRDLANGLTQLGDGQRLAADGADQLASGATQLSDGATQLSDGARQLADGAGQLADGLQQGADRASNAIKDPDAFADLVAHPVEARVTSAHDPGVGGVLAAVGIPAVIWLAALATTLRRRILAPDELATTASTSALVRRAADRLALPVGVVAGVLVLLAHLLLGVPWIAIGGTILAVAALAVAVIALHVLAIALWGRRTGALASIAAFVVQLLAVRGFVPLEIKAEWVQALAPVSPLAQATSALQALAAQGPLGSWAGPIAMLLVLAAVSIGAAWLAVSRRRQASVKGLAAADELRRRRSPAPDGGGADGALGSAPGSPDAHAPAPAGELALAGVGGAAGSGSTAVSSATAGGTAPASSAWPPAAPPSLGAHASSGASPEPAPAPAQTLSPFEERAFGPRPDPRPDTDAERLFGELFPEDGEPRR